MFGYRRCSKIVLFSKERVLSKKLAEEKARKEEGKGAVSDSAYCYLPCSTIFFLYLNYPQIMIRTMEYTRNHHDEQRNNFTGRRNESYLKCISLQDPSR